MKDALSIISGVLFMIAFIPYIRAIRRGETKPAKANTWPVLTMRMASKHTLNGQIIGAVAGAWTVALLALKYGTPGWTRLDKFCLSGAVLGIVLWQTFSDPVLAIVTCAATLVLAAIPTFISAWRDPGKENRTAWMIYFLSCVAAIPAIPKWTLADAAQPVAFTFIETTMVVLLFVVPPVKRSWKGD